MKKIFLIFLLALGFIYAGAQTKQQIDNLNLPAIKLQIPPTNFSGNNQFKELFKLDNNQEKDKISTQIINPEVAQDLSSRGKFSHSTANGSVYNMAPDNMPCLVPNMNKVERMPIGSSSKKNIDRMPNAIPKNKIVQ